MGSVTVTEYVLPTCSYRMGTNRMGAAIVVLGKAEKIRLKAGTDLVDGMLCGCVLGQYSQFPGNPNEIVSSK